MSYGAQIDLRRCRRARALRMRARSARREPETLKKKKFFFQVYFSLLIERVDIFLYFLQTLTTLILTFNYTILSFLVSLFEKISK